jgi:hypothetical protein
MMRFVVDGDEIKDLEVIELGREFKGLRMVEFESPSMVQNKPASFIKIKKHSFKVG